MATENHDTSSKGVQQKMTEQQRHLYRWQNRLLPWLIIMPSILVILFIYLATQQVNHFNAALEIKKESVVEKLAVTDTTELKKLKGNLDYVRWMTLARMEEESLQKRYNQGGLLLLSRIFIKYLGFLTGMIIAIVGAVFIIGKLNEDTTKIEGTAGEKISFSIISSSPGIIFGILGTVLMTTTILQHKEITVQDSPLYLNAYGISSLKSPDKAETDSKNKSTIKIDSAKAAKAFTTQ